MLGALRQGYRPFSKALILQTNSQLTASLRKLSTATLLRHKPLECKRLTLLSITPQIRSISSDDRPTDIGREQPGIDISQIEDGTIVLGSAEDGYPFIVKLMQAIMESAHDGTLFAAGSEVVGVPWWLVVAGTTVVLRSILTLPVYIYQQRSNTKAQKLMAVTEAWRHTMRSSLNLEVAGKGLSAEETNRILEKRLRQKHHLMLLRHGCHPILNFLLPLAQLPIWFTMTFTLRHLCGMPLPWFDNIAEMSAPLPVALGLSTEGLAWFTDLTSVDGTMALPCVVFLLYGANALLSQIVIRRYGSGKISVMSRLVTTAVVTSPFVIGYVATYVPALISFYWAVSAGFSLLQNMFFTNRRVRKALGFPYLPYSSK